MNQKRGLTLGIFLLFLFIPFTFIVHAGFFDQMDFDTTVHLQNFIPRFFDTPFSILSLIGSLESAVLILLLILFKLKRMTYFFVLCGFALFHLVELFGKTFVTHPGPPFSFFRYDLTVLFLSSYIKPGSSFPSGHAGRTSFFVVIFLVLIWNSKLSRQAKLILTFVLCTFSFLMFVSRVYLGEHWGSDVIGGILLGASFGLISYFAPGFVKRLKRPAKSR